MWVLLVHTSVVMQVVVSISDEDMRRQDIEGQSDCEN